MDEAFENWWGNIFGDSQKESMRKAFSAGYACGAYKIGSVQPFRGFSQESHLSAIYCGHANECPSSTICDCPQNCYCKRPGGMCK